VGKFFDGMRQRVDAAAEFAHRLRLLVDLAVDAAGMQHERGGEPTHPAAHDDRFHERRPKCPDSEVRPSVPHPPKRTSESKDTWQIYNSSAASNPKFATGLAAIEVRTSGSRH